VVTLLERFLKIGLFRPGTFRVLMSTPTMKDLLGIELLRAAASCKLVKRPKQTGRRQKNQKTTRRDSEVSFQDGSTFVRSRHHPKFDAFSNQSATHCRSSACTKQQPSYLNCKRPQSFPVTAINVRKISYVHRQAKEPNGHKQVDPGMHGDSGKNCPKASQSVK
jgi:hypothetical protein